MKKNIMPLLLAVCMTASSLPVTAMAGDTAEAGQEEMADGESDGDEPQGEEPDGEEPEGEEPEGDKPQDGGASNGLNGEGSEGENGGSETLSIEEQIEAGEVSVSSITELEEAVAALNADKENDNEVTVNIAEGKYEVTGNEKLTIRRKNVTLKGAGQEKTIINCGEYSNSGQGGIIIDADNVTIEDLTVKSSSESGNVAAIKATALEAIEDEMRLVKNTVIRNVTVSSDNGHGVNLHGTENAVIDGLTVEKAGKAGISLANAVNVTIENTEALSENCSWGSVAMMFAEGEAYKNPVSIVYGEGNDIDYIYADERNAEGYEGVNSIHFEAEYSGAIAGDIREVSVSEGVDVPETFKYAASVNGAYFTTINGAIEAANDGDTVKCAPGTYDENIVFGDKSITLEGAQAGVKPDGENRTDDFRETILTGTISTANGGTTADAFNADQKIVVDGFKFEGDGLKVGDCSYSTVGSLTVKNCIMTFGDNAEDTIEGYGNNTYNYFVKISSVSPEASVTVEDNYVTGNPPAINDTAYVYPLQLWGVKEVSVKNNKIILGEESADNLIDAVNISVMNENAQIEVSGNEIENAHNGIVASTWKLNGTYENADSKFTGTVTVENNTFKDVDGEMIWVGALEEGYNSFAGTVSASGNTNESGEAVEPSIVYTHGDEDAEMATVTIVYNDEKKETHTVQIGDEFTLPEKPSKKGYTFEGWRGDNGKLYDAEEEVTIKEDMTFTAEWEKKDSSSNSSYELEETEAGKTYDIVVTDPSNGSIDVSDDEAARGDTVTVTVTPDEGYILGYLYILDSDGNELKATNNGDGEYEFTMPSENVEIQAVFLKAPDQSDYSFSDVYPTDWFFTSVEYVSERGIMAGVGDGKFNPYGTTTRGMIVSILYRLEGEPQPAGVAPFTDVTSDKYYAKAVAWANENGIVSGYDSDTFGPDDNITREQLASMLYRYAQYKGKDVTYDANALDSFADASKVSAYAVDAVKWAVTEGIISGDGTYINPTAYATRAETASMIMRYNENILLS